MSEFHIARRDVATEGCYWIVHITRAISGDCRRVHSASFDVKNVFSCRLGAQLNLLWLRFLLFCRTQLVTLAFWRDMWIRRSVTLQWHQTVSHQYWRNWWQTAKFRTSLTSDCIHFTLSGRWGRRLRNKISWKNCLFWWAKLKHLASFIRWVCVLFYWWKQTFSTKYVHLATAVGKNTASGSGFPELPKLISLAKGFENADW